MSTKKKKKTKVEKTEKSEHQEHSHPQHPPKTAKKSVHHETPPSMGAILGLGVIMTIAILYLSVNIYASQMIHPIYGKMVNDDTGAWVSFFKIIRSNEKTKPYLQEVQGKYRELQEEINKDNSTRLEMIERLEETLALNPQSREVLYAIATLYKESGNDEKASEYLERARKVDPSLTL